MRYGLSCRGGRCVSTGLCAVCWSVLVVGAADAECGGSLSLLHLLIQLTLVVELLVVLSLDLR